MRLYFFAIIHVGKTKILYEDKIGRDLKVRQTYFNVFGLKFFAVVPTTGSSFEPYWSIISRVNSCFFTSRPSISMHRMTSSENFPICHLHGRYNRLTNVKRGAKCIWHCLYTSLEYALCFSTY